MEQSSKELLWRSYSFHRILDGAQIGKLARGIKRNFRKVEWLDEIPKKELQDCIFVTRN